VKVQCGLIPLPFGFYIGLTFHNVDLNMHAADIRNPGK
jgi:hypothetical protein